MRLKVLFIFVTVIVTSAVAQEETVFGEKNVAWTGSPVVKITSIDGSAGVYLGGYGGAIFDKKWFVGAGGFGLISQTNKYGFGYVGGVLEYLFNTDKLFHLSCGFLIGGGWADNYKEPWKGTEAVFVFDPGVNLILNVHRYLRVGIGASYLFVNGPVVSKSELSSPALNITFKIGKLSK